MFTHVLVPLDGSALAEAVLPTVRAAAADSARIDLCHVVSVVPPVETYMPFDPVAVDNEARAAAMRYLEQVAARMGGAPARQIVRSGAPAEEIVAAAREVGAECIAMSTHGRTGLARLVLGSVADAVVRTSGLPVLLVRPDAAAVGSKGQEAM